MTKIVNSLSMKMEYGSPAINMYLLNNPDHYCSHKFNHVYWQAFVTRARAPWIINRPVNEEIDLTKSTDKVTVFKQHNCVVRISPVLDYMWHPLELEKLNLYDWICHCEQQKKKTPKKPTADIPIETTFNNETLDNEEVTQENNSLSTLLSFLPEHPLEASHGIHWLSDEQKKVPNFIGSNLLRSDSEDRGYYCSTMLTLFKLWRTGLDLKNYEERWEERFEKHLFLS
ncbi:hypothetical protein L208DRAFT_1322163 [Tricholoma matsutake]|nr:hypothetical protein L208DRAFT_1322163 [Tricholoma matsutake 945]